MKLLKSTSAQIIYTFFFYFDKAYNCNGEKTVNKNIKNSIGNLNYIIFKILTLLFLPITVSYATTFCVGPDDPLFQCDHLYSDISSFNQSATVIAGDQVLLKRGETFFEELSISSSGSLNAPITYGAYGDLSDPKPIIKRSDAFDGWWLASEVKNGGQEIVTSQPASDTDDWADFIEQDNNGGCTARVDSIALSGKTSAKLVCQNDSIPFSGGGYVRTYPNFTAKPNTDYYFRISSRFEELSSSDTNPLIIYVKYYSASMGAVYLQSDGGWVQGQLHTFDDLWSGASSGQWEDRSLPITITTPNYAGSLMIIAITFSDIPVWIDNWYLVQGNSLAEEKIWAGYAANLIETKGAAQNGVRLEVEESPATYDPSGMLLGRFYDPKGDAPFYIRNDLSTPPLGVEVGARKKAILINDHNYVNIENIDVYGPGLNAVGGTEHSAAADSAAVAITGNSSNISVSNMMISNAHAVGIWSETSTNNITYDNIISHDNGNTGIYNNAISGAVKNSKSYHNGKLITDTGDRGGIGTNEGGVMLITKNEVYSNSRDDVDSDFEISVVANTGPAIVTKNYVHDCIQGCIQVTNGGNGSTIAHNVVKGFGTSTYGTLPHRGKWSGIKVGGPNDAKDVKVYNNIITEGTQPTQINFIEHAAISFIEGVNDQGEVYNNILYNNDSKHVLVKSGAGTDNSLVRFDHNVYEAPTGGEVKWKYYWHDITSFADWQSYVIAANSKEGAPQFLDAGNADFHISSNDLLVVDQGRTLTGLSDDHDQACFRSTADIGPYEYQDNYLSSNGAITNGGFEVLGEQYPLDDTVSDKWPGIVVQSGTTICPVKADDSVVFEGNYSARMTCDGNGVPFNGGKHSKIYKHVQGILDNELYQLSLWGRVDTAASNLLVVRIRDIANNMYLSPTGDWSTNSTTLALSWDDSQTNQWLKKELRFRTLDGIEASGTDKLEIAIYNFQTGTSWLDHFYFGKVSCD